MKQHVHLILAVILSALLVGACGSTGSEENGGNGEEPSNEPVTITTDQAAYAPGEAVEFTISRSVTSETRVRYKHLDEVVDQSAISGTSWTWTPPTDDFTGYLAEIYRPEADGEKILATIGVDVSSDWTKFPRYGFLSHYGPMEEGEIRGVLDKLNRHHINGLQFYDWHYEHHKMLKGTAENPASEWTNIFNETVSFSTLEGYISAAHDRNMNAMFYNLIYGALENASSDGVSGRWYIYTDQNHSNRDRHSLPQPMFKSDIYLLDPSNTNWQQYMVEENEKVYSALDFDGFHMDQLGDRGSRFDYDGNAVNLANTYRPFIEAMEQEHPAKVQVLNAVNQYGQSGIAQAPTDFLYTEVWSPHESYEALAKIITDNNGFSDGQKNSVLAAYVNYDLADQEGFFNTPSVLFTDAVIFAFGGAHLELGEHMLGKEFFPNDNLSMRSDLQEALVEYYDFMVAYQNLLRDGGTFNQPGLSTFGQVTMNAWPPQQGNVAYVGKEVDGNQVLHLLNFTDATTMNWRDNGGVQAYPYDKKDISLTLETDRLVSKIWYATPDKNSGASRKLEFSQEGGEVSFTLPYLKYWSMVVIEY